MAIYSPAYDKTMGIEGGWANDPDDKGGETWKGIARKMHPEWGGWVIIDSSKADPKFPECLKQSTALEMMVRAFYKSQFWNKLNLDQVNDQAIANELFDTAVNCGTGIAATFLQRALNVTNRNGKDYPDLMVDGSVGLKTVGALNAHPRPAQVLKVLNVLQGEKYISICEHNPSQEKFMSSWLSRVAV
jgi:lysozyme family protein